MSERSPIGLMSSCDIKLALNKLIQAIFDKQSSGRASLLYWSTIMGKENEKPENGNKDDSKINTIVGLDVAGISAILFIVNGGKQEK